MGNRTDASISLLLATELASIGVAMTIRLRCAVCQRKLKVPDEALGKKVQCPACGARFVGQIEAESPAPQPLADSPPAQPEAETALPSLEEAATQAAPLLEAPPVEQPPVELPAHELEETAAPEDFPLDEAPLVDALFAEMASHPLPEVSVPPESLRKDAPPASLFPNLALDEPPVDAGSTEIELEEPIVLDDANAAEPIVLDESEAKEPLVSPEEEPVDIMEEVEEAEEPVRRNKSRRQEKSRKGWVYLLAGVLCVLLLACGGVGFIVYRFVFGE